MANPNKLQKHTPKDEPGKKNPADPVRKAIDWPNVLAIGGMIGTLIVGAAGLLLWSIERVDDDVDRLSQRVDNLADDIREVGSEVSFIKGRLAGSPPTSSATEADGAKISMHTPTSDAGDQP